MKTNNPLLNENWYEQVQIRRLIWESEIKFWKSVASVKEYLTTRKKKYVATHRYD